MGFGYHHFTRFNFETLPKGKRCFFFSSLGFITVLTFKKDHYAPPFSLAHLLYQKLLILTMLIYLKNQASKKATHRKAV